MAARRRRRLLSSPAPADLPDELLWEILLRLPPLPSSLLRATLVCRRWRHLATDPAFLRRFRASHRRSAPLLGFFRASGNCAYFTSLMDPPDRIPAVRFPPPRQALGEHCRFFGCRHGLALILNQTRREAVVWNPVSGNSRRVRFPRGRDIVFGAAVMRPAAFDYDLGQLTPFELVLLCSRICSSRLAQLVARIYRSESGKWVTTTASAAELTAMPWSPMLGPSVMVGNTLCWLIGGGDILQVDLGTRRLALIRRPSNLPLKFDFQILELENNALGFAVVSRELSLQLWQWKAELDEWLLHRELELRKLLSPVPSVGNAWTALLGYAEDANAIFIGWNDDAFMIQLDSFRVTKIPESNKNSPYYPYTSIFHCR
ncbi:unnamed protein product [Urochloa humidicola]